MGFAGARPLASFKGGESWLDVCAHLCRPSRARGFYTSGTQRLRAGLNCVAPTALELRPACAMASARQAGKSGVETPHSKWQRGPSRALGMTR